MSISIRERKLDITLSKKLGLIAGDGELPAKLAEAAKKSGFEIIAIALSQSNKKDLEQNCEKVYRFGPGELQKILEKLHEEEITQLTFIGKVSKGMLFRNPKLDKRALTLLKSLKRLNDDKIMLTLVEELKKENIDVLDQTIFLKDILAATGTIGSIEPTEEQLEDIKYGYNIAKEMGRLDIGQSVVIQDKMILAIEAIEGTDKAIERGAKLGKKGSIVVKVSKPKQDFRFDVPTVGYKTLKTMRRYGARVLAIEAGKTLVVEKAKLVEYANKHNMVVVAL